MQSSGSLSTFRATRRALPTSLRALRHPLTLGSIALLLVNDHVLKALAPSPLTGKLSDLAGLFFFPFLLTALLSLPLDRWRVPPRRTAALAFGATGVWFALIKTVPAANALMVDALTHLLGAPAQIVLDPTDLLALAALVPAWGLWLRLERAPIPRRLRLADLVALGLAALATVATPPVPAQPSIRRLVVANHSIYTDVIDMKMVRFIYVRSDDEGRTWHALDRAETPAKAVTDQLERQAQLPVTVCEPENPQICYRITGTEQVEGSTDGGQTWQVVWQLPQDRREFMDRFIGALGFNTKRELDVGPHDLVLLSQNGASTLIAALGNEGVLVRTPDGDWQQYAVLDARPTPYATYSVLELTLILSREIAIALGIANLAWLACGILGWQIILSKARFPLGRSIWETLPPALPMTAYLLLGCSLIYVFLVFGCGFLPDSPVPMIVVFAAVILVPIAPAFEWVRVVKQSSRPELARRAAFACFLTALGIFPLAWLPFPLWALGIIPVYEMALTLSILIGLVVLVCGITAVRRLSHLAVTPEDTTADLA